MRRRNPRRLAPSAPGPAQSLRGQDRPARRHLAGLGPLLGYEPPAPRADLRCSFGLYFYVARGGRDEGGLRLHAPVAAHRGRDLARAVGPLGATRSRRRNRPTRRRSRSHLPTASRSPRWWPSRKSPGWPGSPRSSPVPTCCSTPRRASASRGRGSGRAAAPPASPRRCTPRTSPPPFSGRTAMTRAKLVRREGGTVRSEKAVEDGINWIVRAPAPGRRLEPGLPRPVPGRRLPHDAQHRVGHRRDRPGPAAAPRRPGTSTRPRAATRGTCGRGSTGSSRTSRPRATCSSAAAITPTSTATRSPRWPSARRTGSRRTRRLKAPGAAGDQLHRRGAEPDDRRLAVRARAAGGHLGLRLADVRPPQRPAGRPERPQERRQGVQDVPRRGRGRRHGRSPIRYLPGRPASPVMTAEGCSAGSTSAGPATSRRWSRAAAHVAADLKQLGRAEHLLLVLRDPVAPQHEEQGLGALERQGPRGADRHAGRRLRLRPRELGPDLPAARPLGHARGAALPRPRSRS